MGTNNIPVCLIEFFTYPRLLIKDKLVGYDFGVFVANRYVVQGTVKQREMAEDLMMEWVKSRQPDYPISICHETEPSLSKHLKTRGGQ